MKLSTGADGQCRCAWSAVAPEMLHYHDTEWGFPVADDVRLFEKLCLEGFQSGLSWRTILVKRQSFRTAFHDFDFRRIARYGERDIQRLLRNQDIIRNRRKIEATINNARRMLELLERSPSLAGFVWQYAPDTECGRRPSDAATTPASHALSRDLKKLGWQFVGPTTVYAFMQAMGLVNDHVEGCVVRSQVETQWRCFKRPSG